MTWTLLAYEDKYFAQLHTLVKALRRDLGRATTIIEGEGVNGTGGFQNELGRQLGRRDKRTKAPASLVICVADADRPQNLAGSNAPAKPQDATPEALDAWVLELEGAWKKRLLEDSRVNPSEASRVEVVCLRWSKESLLVSCPDALLDFAGSTNAAALRNLFARCDPDPTTATDDMFMVRYARPGACMDDVVRAATAGTHKYKKGLHDEDILREHIHPRMDRRRQLLARCPDLLRLLDRIV